MTPTLKLSPPEIVTAKASPAVYASVKKHPSQTIAASNDVVIAYHKWHSLPRWGCTENPPFPWPTAPIGLAPMMAASAKQVPEPVENP